FRIRTGSWGCWMRNAKRSTSVYVMSKMSATAGNYAYGLLAAAGNNASALLSTDGTATIQVGGTTDVCDDRWHFVVATYDGTRAVLYVDGAPEGVGAVANLFPGAGPLNIGAQGANASTAAGAPFYGRVDEAFVTPDVLTDDQIRLLYASRLNHSLGAIPTST